MVGDLRLADDVLAGLGREHPAAVVQGIDDPPAAQVQSQKISSAHLSDGCRGGPSRVRDRLGAAAAIYWQALDFKRLARRVAAPALGAPSNVPALGPESNRRLYILLCVFVRACEGVREGPVVECVGVAGVDFDRF